MKTCIKHMMPFNYLKNKNKEVKRLKNMRNKHTKKEY